VKLTNSFRLATTAASRAPAGFATIAARSIARLTPATAFVLA
jgi:hypothetical protein